MNFTTPRSIGSGTERREAAAGGPYLSPIYYPFYYDRGGERLREENRAWVHWNATGDSSEGNRMLRGGMLIR